LGLFAVMAVLNSSGDGRTPVFKSIKSIPEETTEVGRNTCQVPSTEAAAESSVTLKDGVIDALPVEATVGGVRSGLVMDWTAV
jgi:hypothetical protein